MGHGSRCFRITVCFLGFAFDNCLTAALFTHNSLWQLAISVAPPLTTPHILCGKQQLRNRYASKLTHSLSECRHACLQLPVGGIYHGSKVAALGNYLNYIIAFVQNLIPALLFVDFIFPLLFNCVFLLWWGFSLLD